MSQAIRFHRTGGPEVLQLEDVDVPQPGEGEVRIRHTFAGLNFIDVYHRTGLYPLSLPSGLGEEAVGRVVALGPGVTSLKVGARVGYTGLLGAWCEERVVPAAKVVTLPEAVDDAIAAACLLKGMTAEYLVRRIRPLKSGDTILFHAAAGGVGQLACQWAKAFGARVIGAVSTPEKVAVAKASGCAEVVVTGKRNFVTDVLALTQGKGVDVAYDSVGVSTFEGSLACLKPRGLLVSFGQSSGKPPPLEIGKLGGPRSLFVTRPSLGAYTATRAELEIASSGLFEALAKGFVKVAPPKRVPWEKAAEAMRALESRRTTGSTVLVIDEALAATRPAMTPSAKPSKVRSKPVAAKTQKPSTKKTAAKKKR